MITLNYAKKKENIIIKKTEDYSDRVIRLYQYLIDIKKEKTESIIRILVKIIKTSKRTE